MSDGTAESKALENASIVMLSEPVKKYHETSSGSDSRTLVLTDIGACYFDKNANLRSINFWPQLTTVTFGDVILLCFKTSGLKKDEFHIMKFKSKNNNRGIMYTIGDIIQHVNLPEDVQDMKLENFGIPVASPNGKGMLSRFLSYCCISSRSKSIDVPNLTDTFGPIFATRQKIINLDGDKSQYFDEVLRSVALADWCECVHATEPKTHDLLAFTRYKSSVIHLHIKHCVLGKWDKLCARLSNAQNSQLRGLTFEETDFDSEQLGTLSNSIDHLKSIGFINSLSNPPEFFMTGPMDRLEYVRIENSSQFALEPIVQRFSVLRIMSLANCKIEVRQALCATKGTTIRYLNLSGNKCNETVGQDDFDINTQRIDVNDVSWGRRCLQDFLECVFDIEWTYGLKLSISRFSTTDDIDKTIGNTEKCQLKHLSWSGNRISPDFVDLISSSDTLESLYVDGCFGASSERDVKEFCAALADMSNLKVLSMRGTPQCAMEGSVAGLISKLKGTTIEKLDISYNRIGQRIKGLADVVHDNERLNTIVFDGLNLDSIDSLCEFVVSARQMSRNEMRLSFPQDEVRALLEKGIITKEKLTEFKAKLSGKDTRLPDDEVTAVEGEVPECEENPAKQNDFWDEVFDAECIDITDKFPEYITDELRNEIDNAEAGTEALPVRQKKKHELSPDEPRKRRREHRDAIQSSRRMSKMRDESDHSDLKSVQRRGHDDDSFDHKPSSRRRNETTDYERRPSPRKRVERDDTVSEVTPAKRKILLASDDDEEAFGKRKRNSAKKIEKRRYLPSDDESDDHRPVRRSPMRRKQDSDSDRDHPVKRRFIKLDLSLDGGAKGSSVRRRRASSFSDGDSGFPIQTGKHVTEKVLRTLQTTFSLERLSQEII